MKDVYKSEVAFTLVPSNLGKKGKTCSYSARLKHNQVMFGGFTEGLSVSGKFDAMNAGGKSYALARLKVEVVG